VPRKDRVAGVRSAERAVLSGRADRVLVARDAEERVTKRLVILCREKGIEVGIVDSMRELGESCGLKVGASCCAVLKAPE
jgi:large subunit ribosomal protein L7A